MTKINTVTESILEEVNKAIKKKGIKNTQLITLSSGAMKGIAVYKTGIPPLDIALGVGGIPQGRILEVFGAESSGKTTITLSIIATMQRLGFECAFIDVEHALDRNWAIKCGVDIDNLIFVQPDCAEDALTIAEELVGKVDLSVLDSVSALVPKAELEGEMGDAHMGLQARLMGQAMRKLTGKTSKKNTDVIFINQIRKKIGVTFGSPNTTSGGNALKFYASIRMDIARIGSNKEGEDVVSNNVKIKIVKNKVAPPFKICTAVIDFEHGFDLYANMFPCLLETGVLYKGDAKGKKKQSGNTYYYEDGDKLGVGKPEAMKAFREMFDTESLQVLYENYLDDKLSISEEKSKKKKKKKKGKKNGKSKSTD